MNPLIVALICLFIATFLHHQLNQPIPDNLSLPELYAQIESNGCLVGVMYLAFVFAFIAFSVWIISLIY